MKAMAESNGISNKHKSVTTDSAVPKRRQADEISHRMSRLSLKSTKLISDTKQQSVRPKRQQCSEIAELTSQLNKKLHPSHFTQEVHLKPSDPGYGKPQEGTETAARGKKAHENISGEIVEMAEIIWEHGQITGNFDGDITCILFKDLFSLYNRISGNVVGLLQRGRKYGILHFEGETLFQGRDDMTPVFLISTVEQVKQVFKRKENPEHFNWGVIGEKVMEEEWGEGK